MSENPEQNRIRLLLLDSHGLFRASLARFLASESNFEVVGDSSNTAQALDTLRSSTVEIVLLDFNLGPESGNDFISKAREAGYQGCFLIVAGAAEPKLAAVALQRGASGIFLKSETPDRLVRAIKRVADGEIWIEPKIIQMLVDRLLTECPPVNYPLQSSDVLGHRERDVLLGIVSGLTNKKIGLKIGLSESSVKNIVQRLFHSAGVRTRSQLVRVALKGSVGTERELTNVQFDEADRDHKNVSTPRRGARGLPTVSQS